MMNRSATASRRSASCTINIARGDRRNTEMRRSATAIPLPTKISVVRENCFQTLQDIREMMPIVQT